jgi:large subunit ribosomal protein L5
MMPRLKDKYQNEVVPALVDRFKYKNVMMVPRINKVTINMGVGAAVQDAKAMDSAVKDLTVISGQKPVVTRAKKSVAAFRLREGMPVGCMVTLRGDRMWEFLDKLINVALPRIRDFRGVSPRSFDGRGNYTLGIREQLIFPEIRYDDVERVQGMNITIETTAETDEEGLELLKALGMPFRQ